MSKRAVKITKVELGVIVAAVRATKTFFRKGRISKLVSGEWWSRYKRRWVDAQLHDRVKEALRSGYAIASSDMTTLAHGLHSARYARLATESIPKSKTELKEFLGNLVVKKQTSDSLSSAHCVSLIIDGIEGETENHIFYVDQLADDLLKIRYTSQDLYNDIVSGNLIASEEYISTISDTAVQEIAVKTTVRCTQIWGSFDLQRSAACRRASRASMVPFFMRPFISTDTAAEYIGVMQHATDTMQRIFSADELARRYGKQQVRLRGPEGPLLEAAKPPAEEVELDTGLRIGLDALDPVRKQLLAEASAEVERCREGRSAGAGVQQTLHEHHFAGLTELAAFAITAIRFVQAERHLVEVVNTPQKKLDLGKLLHRQVSNNLEAGVIGRARDLVAAYRAAIIVDAHAPGSGIASETSADDAFKLARAFLAKFDNGTASPNDRHVMTDLDLSHWARCSL